MRKIAYPIFPFLLFMSCDNGVSPPPPSSDVKIERTDFPKVIIHLTDYDLVEVTHQLGTNVYSNELFAVSIGTKDSTQYFELARSTGAFDNQAGAYRLSFSLSAKLD